MSDQEVSIRGLLVDLIPNWQNKNNDCMVHGTVRRITNDILGVYQSTKKDKK